MAPRLLWELAVQYMMLTDSLGVEDACDDDVNGCGPHAQNAAMNMVGTHIKCVLGAKPCQSACDAHGVGGARITSGDGRLT